MLPRYGCANKTGKPDLLIAPLNLAIMSPYRVQVYKCDYHKYLLANNTSNADKNGLLRCCPKEITAIVVLQRRSAFSLRIPCLLSDIWFSAQVETPTGYRCNSAFPYLISGCGMFVDVFSFQISFTPDCGIWWEFFFTAEPISMEQSL